jgi:protein O-GlcNAc transferase
MSLWARVLQELPNSRLVLKGRSNALSAENRRQHVRNIFVNHGISPDRLELLGKEPSYAQHLTHYRRLDIVLDPFPYNGTTTTCEALWMGLPVVTLAGDRHVSRVGVSILSNVGLPELIAGTPEEYVRIATSLADSPKNLSRLRSTLRDRMHRSPLTDSIRLTRALEAEYRNMWVHWCQSEHRSPAPRDTLRLTDG